MSELNIHEITIGQYKGKNINEMLRDRKYCKWIIEQDWFKESYEFLYNKVKNYDPKPYFVKEEKEIVDFIDDYKYFNLQDIDKLEIPLTETDKTCYTFYLNVINDLKNKIKIRQIKNEENIFDIKAPSKWLQHFETETGLKRDTFKEFIGAYELPNITTIVEEIKKYGNIEYKGAQSFKIAKKRSLDQEKYWGDILKIKYKDELGTQFKYEDCIFDFIHIPTNKIFECKLNIKDFNETQYKKYIITLDKYNIIFLIGENCVIDMDMETIYTTNIKEYLMYQCNIPLLTNPSKFDEIIFDYDIYEVDSLQDVI